MTRPSYTYDWDSPDMPGLAGFGLLARRDPDGRPVLNAPTPPGADWAETYSPAVAELARALVPQLLVSTGVNERLLEWLAADFAGLFLCTMPADGGYIPAEVIELWRGEALVRFRNAS